MQCPGVHMFPGGAPTEREVYLKSQEPGVSISYYKYSVFCRSEGDIDSTRYNPDSLRISVRIQALGKPYT